MSAAYVSTVAVGASASRAGGRVCGARPQFSVASPSRGARLRRFAEGADEGDATAEAAAPVPEEVAGDTNEVVAEVEPAVVAEPAEPAVVAEPAAAAAAAVELGGGEGSSEGAQVINELRVDDGEIDWSQIEVSKCYENSLSVREAGENNKRHEKDSGSPEYQIARLTARIKYLTEHVVANKKDFASTRGLIAMVSRRKKLLKYLKAEDMQRYTAIVSGLGIRLSKTLA